MSLRHCPALLISAAGSHSGKTTLVAGMARYWRNQGLRVQVFKLGPDFIDPKFHELASGQPCIQLDLTMMGRDACHRHLYKAAGCNDLILIEGVMGLHDGVVSSAEVAIELGVPVLAIINAEAMAQTFGALALGLASYCPQLKLQQVIANRVGGEGHAQMLRDALPNNIEMVGALPRNSALSLPERHLGLVQAEEQPQLDAQLDRIAALLGDHLTLALPNSVPFFEPAPCATLARLGQPLAGKTIAYACDEAFSFIYRDNLDLLRQLGATLQPFSPLQDAAPESVDALYLPGGYPELHLDALTNNRTMRLGLRQLAYSGIPIVAECGGMLYLLESLADDKGRQAPMLGLLPGHGQLTPQLQGLGLLEAAIPDQNGQLHVIRGHCFHHSLSEIDLAPVATAHQKNSIRQEEPVYQHGRILASYVHWYFPSAPELVADWFGAAR
ncbi:cobyrinate a,c-diamide synthase [Ferrimonas balearica]|uniref:cobyrinate a,c-diamide synthase n=1 Tax=Ferrimonas balearica TaxID=44012 RepID=UPI001C961085|nr:cobyrinate a,c-diamide synthase [Ferrimonas balearica]MBY6108616.1 cobyrinate a,c-diamide synthase [Ferrimonas balearica]